MAANTRRSNIITKLGRESNGQINKECRCCLHEQWSSPNQGKIYSIKTGKKFRKSIIEFMIDKKYISQYSSYLCTDCYYRAESLSPPPKKKNYQNEQYDEILSRDGCSKKSTGNDASENIHSLSLNTLVTLLIEKLQNSNESVNVPYEKWAKLISAIGFKVINPNIYYEGLQLNDVYRDYQNLKNIDFNEYVYQRDKCLVAFLESVSGIAFDKERNNHVKYSICSVIESVYYLRNLNLVLPYSFLFNIVESLISGSKTVTAINGKLHPCGSYPTIQGWLEEQGSEP